MSLGVPDARCASERVTEHSCPTSFPAGHPTYRRLMSHTSQTGQARASKSLQSCTSKGSDWSELTEMRLVVLSGTEIVTLLPGDV
jgi:hypothetical protein